MFADAAFQACQKGDSGFGQLFSGFGYNIKINIASALGVIDTTAKQANFSLAKDFKESADNGVLLLCGKSDISSLHHFANGLLNDAAVAPEVCRVTTTRQFCTITAWFGFM